MIKIVLLIGLIFPTDSAFSAEPKPIDLMKTIQAKGKEKGGGDGEICPSGYFFLDTAFQNMTYPADVLQSLWNLGNNETVISHAIGILEPDLLQAWQVRKQKMQPTGQTIDPISDEGWTVRPDSCLPVQIAAQDLSNNSVEVSKDFLTLARPWEISMFNVHEAWIPHRNSFRKNPSATNNSSELRNKVADVFSYISAVSQGEAPAPTYLNCSFRTEKSTFNPSGRINFEIEISSLNKNVARASILPRSKIAQDSLRFEDGRVFASVSDKGQLFIAGPSASIVGDFRQVNNENATGFHAEIRYIPGATLLTKSNNLTNISLTENLTTYGERKFMTSPAVAKGICKFERESGVSQ